MALDSHHHHHTAMGVRELDLSDCHVNSLSDKINAVPGLRTSTGEYLGLIASYLISLLSYISSSHLIPPSPQVSMTENPSPLPQTLDDIDVQWILHNLISPSSLTPRPRISHLCHLTAGDFLHRPAYLGKLSLPLH